METKTTTKQEQLIELLRAGDRKAQYEVYQRYAKAMLNTAYRIVHNETEAEDVLQEAFVDAFTGIHRFKGEATFGAWLKRIVINKSIDAIKKRRLDLTPLEDYHTSFEEESNENGYDPDWTFEEVNAGINKLPEGFRLVLSLYLIEGYTHDEIAQILNISVSTSKSQYHRAKKKLRKILIAKAYVK